MVTKFAEFVATSSQQCVGGLTRWLLRHCGKYERVVFDRVGDHEEIWNVRVEDLKRVELARTLQLGWRRENAQVSARNRIVLTVDNRQDKIIWNNDRTILPAGGLCQVRSTKWIRRFKARFPSSTLDEVRINQDYLYRARFEQPEWSVVR